MRDTLPGTKRLNSWLSRDQVETILRAPLKTPQGRRDLVVLRLGFSIGLRRQEIVDLDWPDLDHGQLRLVGKGGKAATVAVTPNTHIALDEWNTYLFGPGILTPGLGPIVTSFRNWDGVQRPTGKRLSTNAIRDITVRYSQATGIRFAPHDMRRTFAGLLLDATGSIWQVSAALRHSNIGTTQRYLEQRQDAAAQAVTKAGFDV